MSARNQKPTTRGKAAQETLAHIGLGSNLGDRIATIRRAIAALDDHAAIEVVRTSRLYETEPVGPVAQGRFVNAAAELRTTLDPRSLLEAMQDIEAALGRERGTHVERWGPRTIDLDLLLFGVQVIDAPGLVVPHPEMVNRPFVLVPLCELIPGARHPVDGRPFEVLRDALGPARGVTPLGSAAEVSQR